MSPDDSADEPWERWRRYRPLGPIVVSFALMIAWLVFILLYALFWSSGYSTFQNIIVTLATLVIVALLIGLSWVVWGMKRARHWMKHQAPPQSG
jgi:amino acid transporter